MRFLHFTALICLTLATMAAQAQMFMKPGLYEVTVKPAGNKTAPQTAAVEKPSAPPKAKGAKTSTASGSGITMKMCADEQMVALSGMPATASGNCTLTKEPLVDGVMKFTYNCTAPASSGDGELRIVDANTFSSKLVTRSEIPGIGPLHTELSTKWLGENCGDVKPIALPQMGPTPAK